MTTRTPLEDDDDFQLLDEDEDGTEISPVRRERATNRDMDYSSPVLLHESRKTKITVLPWYVKRSAGQVDTSLKFEVHEYRKSTIGGLWWPNSTLNLNASATRKLFTTLGTFLKAAETETGKAFLIVPVGPGLADLAGHSPDAVAQALVSALDQPSILQQLANTDISAELAEALKQSVKLKQLHTAVAELRATLESGEAEESVYQSWCERHSWSFGHMYVLHDELRDIGHHDSIDLLLPGIVTGFRDVIELKRPDKNVILDDPGRRSWYFSSDVSKAIGQCHRYLDLLGEVAVRGMRDHPEIIAYHPRATIVIGRSNEWGPEQHRALHGLNARLSSIQVMTYDHLLARAERMLELLRAPDDE